MDAFTRAYIACALWSSVGEDERPLDDTCRPYGSSDLYVGDDGKLYVA